MGMLADFGKKLEGLLKEFEELKKKCRTAPEVGKTIEVAGITWRILDHIESGYLAITENFVFDSKKFSEKTSNWKECELREYLNTQFLKKIEEDIGAGNLLEFERDLTSLDGQTEYGTCMDKVSLLNLDEYRKYRKHLPNKKEWWWLITPWSTPCNGYERIVLIVSPSGNVSGNYYFNSGGVRPACIFPSSIFESEEE